MNYYQLKIDDRTNSGWRAILLKDEDVRKEVIKSINENIEIRPIPISKCF
jgi:hypothetical protein